MDARSIRAALVLLSGCVVAACGSSSSTGLVGSGNGPDSGAAGHAGSSGGASAGGSGGSGAAGKTGAGGLPVGEVQCGARVCSPSSAPGVEAFACCAAPDVCGYRLPISPQCLSTNRPGHVNPVCGPYGTAGKVQFSGCCSPTGCGALVTIEGIGCVANQDLGLDPVPCVFDTSGAGGTPPDAAAGPADASAGAP